MKAFEEFADKDSSFWAFVKFITEALGYSGRKQGVVKSYSFADISNVCREYHIPYDPDIINATVLYSEMRADLLNNFVESVLMDADSAQHEFQQLYSLYKDEDLKCTLPLNKQKGTKKQIAYFTAIINILTEVTIRDVTGNCSTKGFDDDPRGLTYVWDADNKIISASSRRFDGAYPGKFSPSIVWEIKEYYYTTTFGSRIADGVYETQLDGFEFKDLYDRTGYKVYHVLFIDAYNTWWNMGKSYLCRIIDILNSGLVDEVIVGREVFSRWPDLLRSLLYEQSRHNTYPR